MNDVVLTGEEREILAEMAARLDDLWLAEQLGGDEILARASRPGRLRTRLPWLASVLFIAGITAALTGVLVMVSVTVTAIAGVIAALAGGWLMWWDRIGRATLGG